MAVKKGTLVRGIREKLEKSREANLAINVFRPICLKPRAK